MDTVVNTTHRQYPEPRNRNRGTVKQQNVLLHYPTIKKIYLSDELKAIAVKQF